jgi:hypothetical protein
MDIRGYEFKTNEGFLDYEFYSDGPKGKIKKVVRFTPQNANGTTYFNLGFGDWDIVENQMDDLAVSNNHDKNQVLVTVAQIVLDFTISFPDLWIYAKGSTSSRTRLYQMAIVANWDRIAPLLYVLGYVNDKWQPFQKKTNYEAFMVLRKKL